MALRHLRRGPRPAPAARRGPADRDGRRPVRAAQGRDHRLVGRHGRRSGLPSRPLPAWPPSRSTTAATARTAASRPATASGCGSSRTSRSTSSGPRRRPAASTETWPRSPSSRPARRAAGGPSSPRRASIGRSRPSAGRSWAEMLRRCRDAVADARRPARPTTSRSSRTGAPRPAPGPTTCASTCTTCPRSRTGSPRRSAAPPASSSARASARSAGSSARSRRGAIGWSGRTPRAWPSRRSPRARRSRSGSCRAATPRTSGTPATPTSRPPRRRCARCWAGSRRASTGRRTTSSSTRRRSASGSTRRTTGTGRSTRACARSPASSWGPVCRSTRSRPRTRSRSSCGSARGRGEED